MSYCLVVGCDIYIDLIEYLHLNFRPALVVHHTAPFNLLSHALLLFLKTIAQFQVTLEPFTQLHTK